MAANETARIKQRTFLRGFLQAAAFSALPWFAIFLAETFGETRLRIFFVDRGMILIGLYASAVYISFAVMNAILAFSSSLVVSRLDFCGQDAAGRKITGLAALSWLTPFSCAVILKFSAMMGNIPLWAVILGIPLLGTLLVLGGLIFLWGTMGRAVLKRKLILAVSSVGILLWLLLVLRLHSPNALPLDFSIYASSAIAMALILIMNFSHSEKSALIPRLRKNLAVLFFSFGFPILSLIIWPLVLHPKVPKVNVPQVETGSAQARPNVIILLADTVRADHLSVYGYDRETTKQLSEELSPGWTVFKNAVCQATNTIPSVKTLFTSRPASSWGMSAFSAPPPRGVYTLARAFLEAGYSTACFSAVEQVSGEGFEEGFQEFLSWSGYQQARRSLAVRYVFCRDDYLNVFRWTRPTKTHAPEGKIIMALAKKWIRSKKAEPFFLYLHLSDPHWPYYNHNLGMIPEELRPYLDKLIYVDLFGVASSGEAEAIRKTPEFLNLVGRYDEELRYTDELTRGFIGFLKKAELWQNTMLILTADHGEELLDHDRFSHGHDVWEELAHIPLIIKWPRSPAFSALPESCETRAGLIDVFPTLIDYLELPRGDVGLEGVSFREILEGRVASSPIRPAISESNDGDILRAAYWEGTKKVRIEFSTAVSPLESSSIQVYDLEKDPKEKSLIPPDDPAVADLISRCRSRFQDIWKLWPDEKGPRPKKKGKKESVQQSVLEKLKSLGYLK